MVQPINSLVVSPSDVQHEQNTRQPSTVGFSIFKALRISNPKPLSEYAIQQLITIESILAREGEIIPRNFDDFSLSLLFNLTQSDEIFCQMKPRLRQIFNDRFTPLQLHRHLNNMMIFILCLECHEFLPSFKRFTINVEKLIKNQLSLLDVDSLLNAAKWNGGQQDPSFFQHLALFFDLEGKQKVSGSHGKKHNWSLLPNVVRNFLISDAMLSQEAPTSLFEANAVYTSQIMKLTAGATMSFATAPVIGPYSLLFLGVPFLISLTSKAYFSSLTAPPNVYPLFDSREIDLSNADNFLGRDEIIKEILSCWRTDKHPLLVGNPGVGKTTIMELVIQRILAGVVPDFENKVAFIGSAAQVMAPNPMGPPHLERMVKTIIPFKNNVILALDEFHALTTDKKSATYVRTMLDGSNGSIRYGLFATTTEDYEKHIQVDESLSRRLKVIDVEALSRDCLIHLLHREVKLANPHMDATPEAIEKIYRHANGKQNESRQLLYKIVRQVETLNHNRFCYTRRQELKDEIQKNEGFARGSYNDLSTQNQFLDLIAEAGEALELVQEECEFFDRVHQKYHTLLQKCSMIAQELSEVSRMINGKLTMALGENGNFNQKVKILSKSEFRNSMQDVFKKMLFLKYFNHPNHVRFLNDYAKLFQLTHVISQDVVDRLLANDQIIENNA